MRLSKLKKTLCPRFDEEDERFELLEAESGEPESCRRERAAYEKQAGEGKSAVPKSVGKAGEIMRRRLFADEDPDVILRDFMIGAERPALAVYMSGMASEEKIDEFVLRPLMNAKNAGADLAKLLKTAVQAGEAKLESDIEKAIPAVTEGMTAVFAEGETKCLLIETRGFEKRAVGQAENEKTVRGPKEGFCESLKTNVTLIRRIIKRPELIASISSSGGENGTKLALLYLKGLTDQRLVAETERRLSRIRTRLVSDSGIVEQLSEDSGLSPVPQVLATERPDRAASHIMNGHVCVIVEGSPEALIMPVTLFSLMNSPEDVYLRRPIGTLLRAVRYMGALASVLLPAYFLALALYHQGLLSTEVLSTVVASRRMVFEPIGVEILLLLFIFQLIREAGQRIPGNIGQAIGIIGGLIMGQAAVAAHLASSVVLIIVAAAGLGNFCIPDHSLRMSAAYFRAAAVIAAWMGGLLALTAAGLFCIIELSDLKSFGVPFLTPFSPRTYSKRPQILRGPITGVSADDYMNPRGDKSRSGRRA